MNNIDCRSDIYPGAFVSYLINDKKYIGKVLNVDKANRIANVWYGYGTSETATDIKRLELADLSNIIQYENRNLLEYISLNDYSNAGSYYSQALHNMIQAINTEFGLKPILNELDYVLEVTNHKTFAKSVLMINQMVLKKLRKDEKNECESR